MGLDGVGDGCEGEVDRVEAVVDDFAGECSLAVGEDVADEREKHGGGGALVVGRLTVMSMEKCEICV